MGTTTSFQEVASKLKNRLGARFDSLPVVPAPVLVTPYLPKDAIAFVKAVAVNPGYPAFVLALEVAPGTCPNCGGGGRVYLRFAKSGPWKYPPGGKDVIFWFDGNELNGKGWYVQHELRAYACPECASRPPTSRH